jgi:hypothetical protein
MFSNYSFLAHHPVNWDDWYLLAHAMASDITVTWQFSQREHLLFSLRFKLHALDKIYLKIHVCSRPEFLKASN